MRTLYISVLVAGFLAGCQTDLGVEELAFSCTDQSECLSGFECVPAGGSSGLKKCVRANTPQDATGADATGADAADTSRDVEGDTSDAPSGDADTSSDTDAKTDANTCQTPCAATETCVDGTCVSEGCTTDDDCERGRLCDEESQCVPVVYGSILIEDVTSSLDCQDISPSPGADIFGVRLLDESGAELAMGRAAEANLASHAGNQHTDADVINSAQAATCPPVEDGAPYVSLGCGGSELLVDFPADSSGTLTLTGGMQVEIGEYDSECDSLASAERYQVFRCTRTGTHCSLLVGGLAGQATVTIP